MVNMGVLTGIQFPLTNFVTRIITGNVERRLSNNEMILSGLLGISFVFARFYGSFLMAQEE